MKFEDYKKSHLENPVIRKKFLKKYNELRKEWARELKKESLNEN